MRKQLIELRKAMKENNIDYYLIPTTDYHGSEYVNDYFKCRKFISGFTGSAGDMLVTADRAGLWTDGRYFLQAASQLEGSGITLMKSGQPGVPTIQEYLEQHISDGQCLGFDGKVVCAEEGRRLEKLISAKNAHVCCDIDLAGSIWTDRPVIKPSEIYALPFESCGRTTKEKITDIRDVMRTENADYCLLANLEEIAWLFNLRGSDIECTPVFFSFVLLTMDSINLYVNREALAPGLVENYVDVKDYNEIYSDIRTLKSGSAIIINETQANYALISGLPSGVSVISKPTPAELLKAIKNPMEISSTRNAHIKDGVAMVNFIFWLKNSVGKFPVTEISAADYLEKCRRNEDGCFDLSFPTIAGYAEHGAIIHYGATPETDADLQPEGFILVDSGGQYTDGTTDITRTIALGPLTEKMKKYYTAVLKSHIRLATMKFAPGTSGFEIDKDVRKPIHDIGQDYNHGTGHGVGHVLSVHEWPNNISPRSGSAPIIPGMITSDEPGIYIEGEFGIRLENEILCLEEADGRYGFEAITFCPFEPAAILPELMTEDELTYINDYHRAVYETISPLVSAEVKEWLADATKEIKHK